MNSEEREIFYEPPSNCAVAPGPSLAKACLRKCNLALSVAFFFLVLCCLSPLAFLLGGGGCGVVSALRCRRSRHCVPGQKREWKWPSSCTEGEHMISRGAGQQAVPEERER